MAVTRTDVVESLKNRTGVAEEALDKLSTDRLTAYYNKTVNPARWVAETMAATPFLGVGLYTMGTGRFIMGGATMALGLFLAFSAKSNFDKNQNVTTDVTREIAVGTSPAP
jgi:hypothetical protein